MRFLHELTRPAIGHPSPQGEEELIREVLSVSVPIRRSAIDRPSPRGDKKKTNAFQSCHQFLSRFFAFRVVRRRVLKVITRLARRHQMLLLVLGLLRCVHLLLLGLLRCIHTQRLRRLLPRAPVRTATLLAGHSSSPDCDPKPAARTGED
jgi:hypothetical protein